MAKFNIEVELDWFHDDVDETLYESVVEGIQDRLISNLEEEMSEKLTKKIDEEVSVIVDKFLENIVVDKIEEIQIPHKESTYSSKVEMVPISQYIGQRFESMARERRYNKYGKEYNRWDDDKSYSLIEYLTNDFIAKELNEKVIEMIRQAKTRAEQTIIESLEENLQTQLNKDIVERLNVPELLKKLQDTVMIEEEK